MKKLLLLLIFPVFCYGQLEAQNVLNQDDVYLVDSLESNTIKFHTNMSLIDSSYYSQIVKNIKKGIDSTNKYIEFKNVEFRVLVFPERTIPRLGMSGVAPNKKQISVQARARILAVWNTVLNFISAENFFRPMLDTNHADYVQVVKETLKFILVPAFTAEK